MDRKTNTLFIEYSNALDAQPLNIPAHMALLSMDRLLDHAKEVGIAVSLDEKAAELEAAIYKVFRDSQKELIK